VSLLDENVQGMLGGTTTAASHVIIQEKPIGFH
jgi:hypothetical protein